MIVDRQHHPQSVWAVLSSHLKASSRSPRGGRVSLGEKERAVPQERSRAEDEVRILPKGFGRKVRLSEFCRRGRYPPGT